MSGEGAEPGAVDVRGSLLIFTGLAGASCGITLLYLGMRSVMDIGGACAEGGPFVPVRPCPHGVVGVMFGGIWGGIISAGLYVWQSFKRHVSYFTAFLWPALFLSLGYNFLDYGLDPPDGSGLVWGWLVCAIVFFLMGGIPLLVVLPHVIRHFREGTPPPSWRQGVIHPSSYRTAASVFRKLASSSARGEPSDVIGTLQRLGTSDMVSTLERLDALHRSGALDDAQYEAAKRKILGQ